MAERPPIFQFPSAELCGCGNCWKKKNRPLRCPNHSANNAFVYETRWFSSIPQCSRDGRYMYTFNYNMELFIVDLSRNMYKVLKKSAQWIRTVEVIRDVVVVDANTIVVLTLRELYLFRLTRDTAEYELRFLRRFDNETNVALLSDVGGRKTRNVLFGSSNTITFVRLNVAEATVDVEQATQSPCKYLGCLAWSKNGRQLYAMERELPEQLHVYSSDQKQWTNVALAKGGPSIEFVWPSVFTHTFYTCEFEGSSVNTSLFRFDQQQRKWEQLLDEVPRYARFHPIVNATDAEEDGVVITEQRGFRLEIQRITVRNPDSLQELALVAARKLREGVQVEEIFRLVTGKAPQCTFLPSAYDGMLPIPVRQLQ